MGVVTMTKAKEGEFYYGIDDYERVQRCLSCEKPNCNNCLEREPNPGGRNKKRWRPRKEPTNGGEQQG